MSSQVRIGIIGCARILNAHLQGFRILQEKGFGDLFRITSLCARQEEDAHCFLVRGLGPGPRPAPVDAPEDPLNAPETFVSDLHPDQKATVYTDYREMLKRGDVDAVCVYTGPDNHHSIAIDAMRAGKHVAVEKPMAITVKAARLMCEVAKEIGVVLGVDENAHFSPAIQASSWAVKSGLIGDVQMVYRGVIGFRTTRPDLVAARTPWRQSKLGAGGGVSIDLGVHWFNAIRTICGPVDSVSAAWKVLEPVRYLMDDEDRNVVQEVTNEVDDVFFANFALENGGIGHMAVSRSGRGTQISVPGGTNVWGSRGALSGGKLHGGMGEPEDIVECFQRDGCDSAVEEAMPRGITDSFALEQLDWLRGIRDGKPLKVSGEEGAIDLALSYAILESGIQKRMVRLEDVISGEAEDYQREINEHYGL